ncbi:hypothetical protein CDAR_301911 [Caerostris darwini]|uniref:Uncharacterized protein n=1 Tax=Caerostris darwini TaxID=1538125 RepID=A0AAV4UGQ8_9ARAC|nr:hypothetical protein CDAR_301911 [Caerostris darwini]
MHWIKEQKEAIINLITAEEQFSFQIQSIYTNPYNCWNNKPPTQAETRKVSFPCHAIIFPGFWGPPSMSWTPPPIRESVEPHDCPSQEVDRKGAVMVPTGLREDEVGFAYKKYDRHSLQCF